MIKVLVPSMPTADELLPYLREIDERRVYVNGGPLVRQLEERIAQWVGNPCRVVSNGTVSLELALRAMGLPPGAGVLVPAVTYVASGQAIVNAGLTPVLADVHPRTWQLDADDALTICRGEHRIRAVMPVATFGAPVPVEPWEKFTYDTNLPVLIDAAGALPSQQTSPIPDIVLSFSLHATKAIGCGEGGAIVTCDRLLLERVEQLASFGPGGTNAKMSEYHAAVGLASMGRCGYEVAKDVWHPPAPQGVRYDWRGHLADLYRENLPEGIDCDLPYGGHGGTLCPVLLPDGQYNDAQTVLGKLGRLSRHSAAADIETKRWYAPFLDERPEFAHFPRQPSLVVTEMLRRRCLGLPWHAFLTEADVQAVCAALREVLA